MEKDILGLLSNKEKWFLGDGEKLCFTPEFPEYRDTLGFFDKASYINFTIDHLFAINFIEDDAALSMAYESRTWYPHKVESWYHGKGVRIIENKSVVNGCFSSEICIINKGNNTRALDTVIWCPNTNSSEGGKGVRDFEFDNNILTYSMNTGQEYGMPGKELKLALSCSERINSYSVNLSQGRAVKNIWEMTPFYDKLSGGNLKNEIKLEGLDTDGIVYSAIAFRLHLAPGERKNFKVIKTVGDDRGDAIEKIHRNITKCLNEESKKQWEEYFKSLPQFHCSDEYINKYYWYRWYGIRLNTISAGSGNYRHPFITEGIGFFRSLITYSATCMALEARWLNDKKLSEAIFYNIIDNQLNNGFFPGIIRENHIVGEIIYHTFWGKAVLATYQKYRDKKFLEKMYEPLVKYAAYFESDRDKEGSCLFDIKNQIETGQEYSPRYLFANKKADLDIDILLKGVDSSTYMYDLYDSLDFIAGELGYHDDKNIWCERAEKVKESILENLWNDPDSMFYDLCIENCDGENLYKRSNVKALTGFYPFMTDITDKKHIEAIYKHMLNEKEFWSPYPITTLSMDDPCFNSDAEWKGKRHVCPWNGRVWPITNCHIIEALSKQSSCCPDLKEKLVELIRKTIYMMYSSGDINMPNCYEHYNPINGRESFYRGVNDYMHSWIIDIILRFAVGIKIDEKGVVIDPLDFQINFFELDNLYYCGHKISVSWNERDNSRIFCIMVDGKTVHLSDRLEAVDISRYL